MLDGPELVGVEVRGCYVIMRRPRRFRAGLMPVCGSPRPLTSHRLIASKPPTYAAYDLFLVPVQKSYPSLKESHDALLSPTSARLSTLYTMQAFRLYPAKAAACSTPLSPTSA